MTNCRVLQLLEPIAISPQAFTTRTGFADSMEAVDSASLIESKDIAFLTENGRGSMWVFQRQPANTAAHDVQLLDDPAARWRLTMGDITE